MLRMRVQHERRRRHSSSGVVVARFYPAVGPLMITSGMDDPTQILLSRSDIASAG
jgi:hypothetical protein